MVSQGSAHGGKSDPGVSGGRFDDGGAGSKFSLRFRPGDHVGSHPVFGAAGGIFAFQFCQEHGLQAMVLFIVTQFQQAGSGR